LAENRSLMMIKCLIGYILIVAPSLAQSSNIGGPSQNKWFGVIVMSPVNDLTQNHLQLAATFLVTGDIAPGSRMVAVAKLPSGQQLVLRDFSPQPATSRCSPCSSDGRRGPLPRCSPTSYPLTGFDLPVRSVPAHSVVTVTLTPSRLFAGRFTPVMIWTGRVLRGAEQSPDRLTITLPGNFDSSAPAEVYFGLWPVPVRSDAVTVRQDRLTIDLRKDRVAARWMSDLYPLTIHQPGEPCDTVLLRFLSPVEVH
jgi:hypothetical protein